jgi:hypothetical protein
VLKVTLDTSFWVERSEGKVVLGREIVTALIFPVIEFSYFNLYHRANCCPNEQMRFCVYCIVA